MKIKKIANMTGGQDGAIYGGLLFRFDTRGLGRVYDLKELKEDEVTELNEISSFCLDKAELIAPHSNAVVFGNEFYCDGDEFPLLYSNIYNNYAGADNPLKGVCCVYRLQRNGTDFCTTLVQLIEIGFVEDAVLWKSDENADDVRPYGNFVIDAVNGVYYAFTMRDKTNTTRYFAFDLPQVFDGVTDDKYNVKKVTLGEADIKKYFDCEYHRFIQGACFHGGKIYSTEGFHSGSKQIPAIRVIDAQSGRQIEYADLAAMGYDVEPEMIDFHDEVCLYSNAHGELYMIEFDE